MVYLIEHLLDPFQYHAMEGTTMTISNVINSPKVTNTAIIDKIRLLKHNLYWKNFTNGCIM